MAVHHRFLSRFVLDPNHSHSIIVTQDEHLYCGRVCTHSIRTRGIMKTSLSVLVAIALLLAALRAVAQQQPSPAKTIPDSINYMWKMVESDFTSLAEAMPQEKWSFKPTQGAFTDVRTFAEQVKHVACANEAWAKKLRGETPPDRCDTG